MSENIQSISLGSYTLGSTNKLTFSAGPGIKIDEPSEGTVRIGTDETVLWSGTPVATVTSLSLSETWKNFDKIKIYGKSEGGPLYSEFLTDNMLRASMKETCLTNGGFADWNGTNFFVNVTIPCHFEDDNIVSSRNCRYVGYWDNAWQALEISNNNNIITHIIGINRISGGNE